MLAASLLGSHGSSPRQPASIPGNRVDHDLTVMIHAFSRRSHHDL
jgi:hypothetical protein